MTIHTPITKPSWQDRVTYARANEALGPLHIAAIRDEALALIGPGHCDNAINRAIATACQGYLDCVGYPDDCAQYLDEIDALLFDDEPGIAYVEDLYWRDSDYAIERGMGQ